MKGNPFQSIRASMTFFFFILIVSSVLIFFGISIKVTEDAALENSMEYTEQLISQLNNDIDSYINYMENISTIVSSGQDVKEYLGSKKLSKEREEVLSGRIIGDFETILNMREDIYNIGIVGENGRVLLNRGNSKMNPYVDNHNMDWYKDAIAAKGFRVLSSSHVQNIIEDEYKWVVTMSKMIVSKEDNTPIGVFFVDLNYTAIIKLCQNIQLGKKGYVFLMDSNGKIIYHPKQQLIYSGLQSEKTKEILESKSDNFIIKENGNQKLYAMAKSQKTNWQSVGVANIYELIPNRDETMAAYFYTTAFLLIVAVTIAFLFSNRITRPITELRNSMKKVEKGELTNVHLKVDKTNEIGMLRQSFNIMTRELENLMADKVKDQELKYQLELKALLAQMNPHFLYNTLDSIVWMAEIADNTEVVTMTSALAKLLRQNINSEDTTITIGQEIENIKSYLTIQKMRYKEQLSYKIEVEPNMLSVRIIKLILQPIVENAIYHGIKYRETKGTITVKGFIQEDTIVFQIIDDGIGMDEEALSHIFDKKEARGKGSGVGVSNVNKRIKLYYGDYYGLEYTSVKNQGTCVSIILPYGEGKNNYV